MAGLLDVWPGCPANVRSFLGFIKDIPCKRKGDVVVQTKVVLSLSPVVV